MVSKGALVASALLCEGPLAGTLVGEEGGIIIVQDDVMDEKVWSRERVQ